MKGFRYIYYILFTLFCVFSCKAQNKDLPTFKVVRIIDGDTVVVLNSKNEQLKIRLAEIDCPEKAQDFGNKARQFTSDAIFSKKVQIDLLEQDRYGRYIGKIYYNQKYLSEELVKNGLAIVYRKYSDSKKLLELEEQAKNKKIGIWSLKNFENPESFRHSKK